MEAVKNTLYVYAYDRHFPNSSIAELLKVDPPPTPHKGGFVQRKRVDATINNQTHAKLIITDDTSFNEDDNDGDTGGQPLGLARR